MTFELYSLCSPCLKKRDTPNSSPYLSQILTDIQNSFTVWFVSKCVVNWLLMIPPCLKCVTALPCEIFLLENCCVQDLSEANHHIKSSCIDHSWSSITHPGRGSDSLVPIEAGSRTQAEVYGVGRLLHAKVHPNRCRGGVCGPKIETFTTILAYKRPTGVYPLCDFFCIFSRFLGISLVLTEASGFYLKFYGMWQSAFFSKT